MTTSARTLRGIAAPLQIANLDTDQIMPKQFLHGIDKSGLDRGLLWNHRFDADGRLRPDFVLNQPRYANASILIAGANFGCGSSREHAVWGLQQFGIVAVIASSFGEIFYSNAMNNRLLAVRMDEASVQTLFAEERLSGDGLQLDIDVGEQMVRSPSGEHAFTLSERHRDMFLRAQDLIGATLVFEDEIAAFAERRWASQPWTRDVASKVRTRLSRIESPAPVAPENRPEASPQR